MAEWAQTLERPVRDFHWVAHGTSGFILELDERTVIKRSLGEGNRADHETEREIYERLGDHPRIVNGIFMHPKGIILERLQDPLRLRLIQLRERNVLPTKEQILKWSRQASEAIEYLHGKHVFQVDIAFLNMLFDDQDDIKLCDFAGSSIDGRVPSVVAGAHEGFHLFANKRTKPSVHTELYALGCVIFEISTTQRPYHGKTDKEIERLYEAGEFPDTNHLLLGPVIRKCWTFQYNSATKVIDEIDKIIDK
ncbi:hypothetical protein AYL99_09863 [Fonsecaea erecta]|uniref:Protein kinase domain-containing protein n=1 Tax=Fonsecaea erecta TaxID=1367422 RepID=A0A178Z889_9EURO|nr:hypothetical protein AYL99_09863 [Fonsecaea erecta]OAP55711.1 hypothetical protein AYL99_09863 [Fonsecaea erecta]